MKKVFKGLIIGGSVAIAAAGVTTAVILTTHKNKSVHIIEPTKKEITIPQGMYTSSFNFNLAKDLCIGEELTVSIENIRSQPVGANIVIGSAVVSGRNILIPFNLEQATNGNENICIYVDFKFECKKNGNLVWTDKISDYCVKTIYNPEELCIEQTTIETKADKAMATFNFVSSNNVPIYKDACDVEIRIKEDVSEFEGLFPIVGNIDRVDDTHINVDIGIAKNAGAIYDNEFVNFGLVFTVWKKDDHTQPLYSKDFENLSVIYKYDADKFHIDDEDVQKVTTSKDKGTGSTNLFFAVPDMQTWLLDDLNKLKAEIDTRQSNDHIILDQENISFEGRKLKGTDETIDGFYVHIPYTITDDAVADDVCAFNLKIKSVVDDTTEWEQCINWFQIKYDPNYECKVELIGSRHQRLYKTELNRIDNIRSLNVLMFKPNDTKDLYRLSIEIKCLNNENVICPSVEIFNNTIYAPIFLKENFGCLHNLQFKVANTYSSHKWETTISGITIDSRYSAGGEYETKLIEWSADTYKKIPSNFSNNKQQLIINAFTCPSIPGKDLTSNVEIFVRSSHGYVNFESSVISFSNESSLIRLLPTITRPGEEDISYWMIAYCEYGAILLDWSKKAYLS